MGIEPTLAAWEETHTDCSAAQYLIKTDCQVDFTDLTLRKFRFKLFFPYKALPLAKNQS